MSTVTWGAPGAASSDLAAGALDGLANGATSTLLGPFDNSTARNTQAALAIALGAIIPTVGGSVTVRAFAAVNGVVPDNTGSVGGGDAYTIPLPVAAGAKKINVPMVRLYPFPMYLTVTNNAGVAFSSSAGTNTLQVVPYPESAN